MRRIVQAVNVVLLAIAIVQPALRWVHFSIIPLQSLIPAHWISPLHLVIAVFTFMVGRLHIIAPYYIPLAVGIAAIGSNHWMAVSRFSPVRKLAATVRYVFTVRTDHGRLTWHPLIWSAILIGFGLCSVGLDLYPELMACELVVAVLYWTLPPRQAHTRHAAIAGFLGVGMALSAWLLHPITMLDSAIMLCWFVLVSTLGRHWASRFTFGTYLSLWLMLAPVLYVVVGVLASSAAMTPVVGRSARLASAENGIGYSFCEMRNGQEVAVLFPRCDMNFSQDCLDGTITVFDPATLSETYSVRPFINEGFGRLHEIICFDDTMYVSFNILRPTGNESSKMDTHYLTRGQVGAFKLIRNRDTFEVIGAADNEGEMMAVPGTDAILLASELSDTLLRWDRASATPTEVGEHLRRARIGTRPVLSVRNHGSVEIGHNARDAEGDYGYFSSWPNGDAIFEVDLRSFQVNRIFDSGVGGVVVTSVDTLNHRLLAFGFWGFAVFDLITGKHLTNVRTEFTPRTAAIDYQTNTLIVPATGGINLRVYDLDTYSLINKIPMGIGSRKPWISAANRQLWTGNRTSVFVFDLDSTRTK